MSEPRIDEVMNKLQSFSFYPKQTNAFDLYAACGEEWAKINLAELTYKDWNVSWEDCPKEMLSYLQSLPEFDAALFKEITGIKNNQSEAKKKAQELEDEATKLLAKAKELRSSL